MSNLKFVIVDDQPNTNGWRYTRDALEAIVARIAKVKVPILPGITVDWQTNLPAALGVLNSDVILEVGSPGGVDGHTHLEIHVEASAGPVLLEFLDKCSRSNVLMVLAASGIGNLQEGTIGSEYVLEYVGLCTADKSSIKSARILEFSAPKPA